MRHNERSNIEGSVEDSDHQRPGTFCRIRNLRFGNCKHKQKL
jgi:hypothetical protein